MIQINVGDHSSPVGYYHPVPPSLLPQFQWARQQALWIANNKPGADPYFQSLPKGRSLSDLLADSGIWINYSDDSEMSQPCSGETSGPGDTEITITKSTTMVGQWSILATLIHELAHVDGVPGGLASGEFGPPDTRAEDALLPCGLGYLSEQSSGVDDPNTPYMPGTDG
jgi:hypothetical protein